jgi:hypothetical protein
MGVGEIERRVDFLALVRTEIFLQPLQQSLLSRTSFATVLEKSCVRASDDAPIMPL